MKTCSHCGAPLPVKGNKCEYCGSVFKAVKPEPARPKLRRSRSGFWVWLEAFIEWWFETTPAFPDYSLARDVETAALAFKVK